MELYDNIRKISFWFFTAVGLVHFITGMMYIQQYFVPTTGVINRVTFIPFFVAAYTFFYAHFKCFLMENGNDRRWISNLLLSIGVCLFVVIIGIEFFATDDLTPLIRP